MGPLSVSVLSRRQWQSALRPAELPFGREAWLAVGMAQHPEFRLIRVVVRVNTDAEVLVPLCLVQNGTGQIGCIGYGGMYPTRLDTRPPAFSAVAEVLCEHFRLRQVRSLLPPVEVSQEAYQLSLGADIMPGRPTYLLDIRRGSAAVWDAVRGNVRTAVRRAIALGLTARPMAIQHGEELLRLYGETLARNGVSGRLNRAHIDAVLGEMDSGSAAGTMVVDESGTGLAATLFGVAANRGYHIMQASSRSGRRLNAGHLSLWSTVSELVERGVVLLDLGSANNDGQRRFKLAWGSVEAVPRLVRWAASRTGGAA